MTDTQVILKIKELKQIKPREDWVVLTKAQILGQELSFKEKFSDILNVFPRFSFGFQYKPAFATITVLVVLIGLFGFAQNSLPGDLLYSIKKVGEKGQMVFVSEQNLSKAQLDLASKRLEELDIIAQTNQVRKLGPAIEEFQANIAEAAKNLAKIGEIDEEFVEKTKEIRENKEKIEKILATKIETKELDDALSLLVEREIKDLENRTLSEEQKELFEEAKIYYNEGNYQEALMKILGLSQILY